MKRLIKTRWNTNNFNITYSLFLQYDYLQWETKISRKSAKIIKVISQWRNICITVWQKTASDASVRCSRNPPRPQWRFNLASHFEKSWKCFSDNKVAADFVGGSELLKRSPKFRCLGRKYVIKLKAMTVYTNSPSFTDALIYRLKNRGKYRIPRHGPQRKLSSI